MDGLISSQYTDISQLQEAKGRRTADKVSSLKNRDLTVMSDKDVRGVAQEFEAFFLSQVFEYLTKDLSPDGLFGGGHAEGIYRSMMNEQYGKAVAERGGYGIGDLIYRDIIKVQTAQLAAKESEEPPSVKTKAQEGAEAYQALDKGLRHPSLTPIESPRLEQKGVSNGT